MLGLYWRDQPPKEIAKKLGVSPLRISQIKAVAIMKLQAQFSSMGVTAGAI
jgi:DNA-directed RNA polymerase specialized sigma subunit